MDHQISNYNSTNYLLRQNIESNLLFLKSKGVNFTKLNIKVPEPCLSNDRDLDKLKSVNEILIKYMQQLSPLMDPIIHLSRCNGNPCNCAFHSNYNTSTNELIRNTQQVQFNKSIAQQVAEDSRQIDSIFNDLSSRASQKCIYCNQYLLGGQPTQDGNAHLDCIHNLIRGSQPIVDQYIEPTTPIDQSITSNKVCPGAPKINARRGVKETIDTTTYPISYTTPTVCPNTKSNLCCYEPSCPVCSH